MQSNIAGVVRRIFFLIQMTNNNNNKLPTPSVSKVTICYPPPTMYPK